MSYAPSTKGRRDVTLSTIRLLANALDVLPGTLVNGETPEHKNINIIYHVNLWKKLQSLLLMENLLRI